jgi:hypothetical protein
MHSKEREWLESLYGTRKLAWLQAPQSEEFQPRTQYVASVSAGAPTKRCPSSTEKMATRRRSVFLGSIGWSCQACPFATAAS